jgi:predicted DNA-binding transcriptional regulator YafY
MELIRKLESFTSRHQAQRLSRQIFVANRVKTMNESIYYNVDFIHEAISSNSKIGFQYFDWNVEKQKELRHGGKKYEVSPFALTTDDENYYLIAYDSESAIVKHYRVDKMINIKILDEKRDGAKNFEDFDLAIYTKKTFGMYHGDETLVTLRCKNSLSGVIIDRFGRDETFFARDDGYFDVNVKVAVSRVFLSWLMMFDGDIEVIAPASVRDDIVKLASDTLNKYK